MTKSKPKPVKPVLAWCALNRDDCIRPGWCATDKATVARWAEHFGRAMILVEIRPAPKRGEHDAWAGRVMGDQAMTHTPLTKAEREELRRLHDAANPGPWNWRINRAHKSVELESPKEGGWTVMGFERWGMSSACPSFRKIVDGHSILTRADKMARNIPGRDHHSDWCQDIDQPDAILLAAARNALPRLLADLDAANGQCAAEIIRKEIAISRADAAEAKRDFVTEALHESVDACGLDYTASLPKAIANIRAQRDRAEAELATMRADRDAALIHLPVCCGSLADAADTLRQERDELAAERDALKAKLAALVEAAGRVRIAEDVYAGSEDQSTDYQEVHRSTTDLWAMLDAAIAAARGGAQ